MCQLKKNYPLNRSKVFLLNEAGDEKNLNFVAIVVCSSLLLLSNEAIGEKETVAQFWEKKTKIKLKLSNSATVSRFAPSIEKYFGQVQQFVKLGEIDRCALT